RGWWTMEVEGVPPRTPCRVNDFTVPRPGDDPHGDAAASPSPHNDAIIPAVEIQADLARLLRAERARVVGWPVAPRQHNRHRPIPPTLDLSADGVVGHLDGPHVGQQCVIPIRHLPPPVAPPLERAGPPRPVTRVVL